MDNIINTVDITTIKATKSQTKTWSVSTPTKTTQTCTLVFDGLTNIVGFSKFSIYVEGSYDGVSDWTTWVKINGQYVKNNGGWIPAFDGSNRISFTTYIDLSSSSWGTIQVSATAVGY